MKSPKMVLVVGSIGLAMNILGLFLFHSHSHHHEKQIIETAKSLETMRATINSPLSGTSQDNFEIQIDDNYVHTHTHSHDHGHLNMHGVFLHILGDALGSVAVIITAVMNIFIKDRWVVYVDPVCSVIIVAIISVSAWPLLKSTVLILLQSVPHGIDVNQIRERLCGIKGVLDVHGTLSPLLQTNPCFRSSYMAVIRYQKRCIRTHHSLTHYPKHTT
jgi:zinc transporter 1